MEKIKLYNGMEIPAIAYGSAILEKYRLWSNDNVSKVKYYTKNFFMNREQFNKDIGTKTILKKENDDILIDTSRAYIGSENIIGKYKQTKSMICTKICNFDQINNNVTNGIEQSLKALGVDKIDILLMHWPVTDKYIDTWRYMEELYEKGIVKAIGVCNCNIHHLERIKKETSKIPMINQVECHPFLTQNELREYCRQNKIQVMAYTATARMDDRLRNTVLPEIAKKYGKSIAQIIIRWHIQLGNIPIINTCNYQHYLENKEVFDFHLTEDEMDQITSLNINSRLRYDPDNCDFNKL